MERTLKFEDESLLKKVRSKYALIDVLNDYNGKIAKLTEERQDKMLDLDTLKLEIVSKVEELSKDEKSEFEIAQTTKEVDGKVEVVFVDMLDKAKESIRNEFVRSLKENKKNLKKALKERKKK